MRILALSLLSTLLLAAPLHAQEKAADTSAGKDYVVLKVGGDSVMKSEVESVWKTIFPGENPPPFDTFDAKVKDNVLRGVASEHILEKEADKAGVPSQPEVKERLANAERQIVIQEFLKEKTKDLVSDDKLKAMYDEKVKAMAASGDDEVHARHILVKTEADAKDIEKKLKKGGDFEKLAQEKSEDPGSKTSGGDLGWFTKDKMVPEFSKAAFALKKGEISAPVKTDFGWHVIQLVDRRKVSAPPFDQMKEELRQEAGNKAVSDYVKDLMKTVKITELDADGHEKDLPAMSPAAGSPEK